LATVSLVVALIMATVGSVTSALPEIALHTGATASQLTWVIDAYTLVLACLLLSTGALGDRFGKRRMLVLGLLILVAGALIPMVDDSVHWVMVSRAISGLGAACAMPSTLSIITSVFPVDQRLRAVGVWAGAAGAGGVAGVLGAGVILEFGSWRTIFVATAIWAALMVVGALYLPADEIPDADAPFDLPGCVLSAAAIGSVTFSLIEGPAHGWTHPLVLVPAIGSWVLGAAFIWWELRTPRPVIELRLFRDSLFSAGTVVIVLQFLAIFGSLYMLMQYFQLALDYSPLTAAVAIAPLAGPLVIFSVLSHRLTERIGMKRILVGGLVVLAAGFAALALVGTDSYPAILLALLTIGAGVGVSSAPATTAIVLAVPDDEQNVASAMNDTARELGATLGIALCASMLTESYRSTMNRDPIPLPGSGWDSVSDSLPGALEVAHSLEAQTYNPAVTQQLVAQAKDAFVGSLRWRRCR
jgi:EmrB/QacA subfamily drug resistance transporter